MRFILSKKIYKIIFALALVLGPSFVWADVTSPSSEALKKYCFTVTQSGGAGMAASGGNGTTEICAASLVLCQSNKRMGEEKWNNSWGGPPDGDPTKITRVWSECVSKDLDPNNSIDQRRLAAATAENQKGTCSLSLTGNFSLLACLKDLMAAMAIAAVWLVSRLLWLAAGTFNQILEISILSFKSLADSPAVLKIWGLGRDLANICFIFILMYIAIGTIVQKSGIETKKMVVRLIITALLINFSILIPKVIIDVGNTLAVVFYQNTGSLNSDGKPDIASAIVQSFQPQNVTGSDTNASSSSPIFDKLESYTWSDIFIKSTGTIILIIILCYALLLAGYMFLARTVVLVFLIATSSIVFFTRVIPLKGLNKWDQWFNALINETFFAPIFLFLFYLVISLAKGPTPKITSGSSGGLVTNVAMNVVWYLILCGMAIGSTIISKKMAAESGKWAKNAKDSVAKYGGAWVARNTAGRATSRIANSEGIKNLAAKRPVIGGAIKNAASLVANTKYGGKNFEEGQQASATRAKETMKGMSSEQKAEFLSNNTNLGRWTGTKERNKLISESLKELKGQEEGSETTKRYNALFGIEKDEKNRSKILKEMSDGEVAKMLLESETDTNPERKSFFDKFKNDLADDIERSQKIDKLIKEEKDRGNRAKAKDITSDYTKLFELGKSEEQQRDILTSMSDGDLYKVLQRGKKDPSRQAFFTNFESALDTERRQKIETMAEKEDKTKEDKQKQDERKIRLEDFKQKIANAATGDVEKIEGLKKLKSGDIENLDTETVNSLAGNETLLKTMNSSGMIELVKHKGLKDQNKLLATLDGMKNDKAKYGGMTKGQQKMIDMFTDTTSLANILK